MVDNTKRPQTGRKKTFGAGPKAAGTGRPTTKGRTSSRPNTKGEGFTEPGKRSFQKTTGEERATKPAVRGEGRPPLRGEKPSRPGFAGKPSRGMYPGKPGRPSKPGRPVGEEKPQKGRSPEGNEFFEENEKKEGILSGRRGVIEALKNGMEINKIFVVNGEREGSIKEVVAIAKERRIPLVFVDRKKIEELTMGDKHQGVAASIPPVAYSDLDSILAREATNNIIVVLDGIEDPHNLGAIIRSAEVAGIKGIIIPKRRGVLLTETVAKASAGAVLHMPVARVPNLVQTIGYLKEQGYWVVGADMQGEKLWDTKLQQPLVLVIGGEGKGISRLLKENCDFLASIPLLGKVDSLNASVAAGILLFEILRQNQIK